MATFNFLFCVLIFHLAEVSLVLLSCDVTLLTTQCNFWRYAVAYCLTNGLDLSPHLLIRVVVARIWFTWEQLSAKCCLFSFFSPGDVYTFESPHWGTADTHNKDSFCWESRGRKHRGLRPQKPLRLIRDREVGGSWILYQTPTRYTVTTRMILH